MKTIPRLVVVEGAHGSGKTTLAKSLTVRLNRAGWRSRYTKEPYSPFLSKAISILASKSGRDPLALAYLISTDRHLHLGQIERWVKLGETIISDRYLDSSLVYQRIDGLDLDFINRLNFFAPNPKLKIYVSAPLRVRLDRLRKKRREESAHSFLSLKSLRAEQRFYDQLISLKGRRPNGLVLDGTQPISKNVEIAKQFVLKNILPGAKSPVR
jgi:dTMP kinase